MKKVEAEPLLHVVLGHRLLAVKHQCDVIPALTLVVTSIHERRVDVAARHTLTRSQL